MFEEAVEKLEACVTIEGTALRYDLLAQCRSELEQYEEALLDAIRATSLDPQVREQLRVWVVFSGARVVLSVNEPGAFRK